MQNEVNLEFLNSCNELEELNLKNTKYTNLNCKNLKILILSEIKSEFLRELINANPDISITLKKHQLIKNRVLDLS